MNGQKLAVVTLSLLAVSAAIGGVDPESGIRRPPRDPAKVPAGTDPDDPLASTMLLREGTEIEGIEGAVREEESRFVFVESQSSRKFVLLENLALERVARLVGWANQSLDCRITGRITEYRGVNFLLLQRAVIDTAGKGKSSAPSPGQGGKGT